MITDALLGVIHYLLSLVTTSLASLSGLVSLAHLSAATVWMMQFDAVLPVSDALAVASVLGSFVVVMLTVKLTLYAAQLIRG